VERVAVLLIPVGEPFGGALVVGYQSVRYLDGRRSIVSQVNLSVSAWTKIDNTRYLLGDQNGKVQ
jgi:hypothetical protein